MTVVIGTAGHIDHGKTALLRALTGIDADRLPEERRRGMTLDVGYAHLAMPDGSELDFVDVPGHDRLVGNMLVGAGEIDAVMLVVAADDGPRAQTMEHLELLDALGVGHGIAVVTKADLVDGSRLATVRDAVGERLRGTSLAGSPVVEVSSVDGRGIPALRDALTGLRDRVLADRIGRRPGRPSLAIDRVFTVKGRGVVVTGTLRGRLARNDPLRVVPGERTVRARELQVHGRTVETAGAGRVALNLAGVDAADLRRGAVLTSDPSVVGTDRMLVRLTAPLPDRTRVRLHLGTAAVDGAVGRAGYDAIDLPGSGVGGIVRLAGAVAATPGDRFLLRRQAGADRVVGGIVLDTTPPRAISRRRQSAERVGRLVTAIDAGDGDGIERARLDLHGARAGERGRVALADDVAADGLRAGLDAVAAAVADTGAPAGLPTVRSLVARAVRRLATLHRDDAAAAAAVLVDQLVDDGRLIRDGDRLRLPGSRPLDAGPADPALAAAMDRLEAALAVVAPPPLSEASRAAGCPPAGVRELERAGRIVVLDPELAYAVPTYRGLEERALDLARRAALTPATLRDATGTSRKYVMAILADLDRRGVLRRTDAGHVPGPRAGVTGNP